MTMPLYHQRSQSYFTEKYNSFYRKSSRPIFHLKHSQNYWLIYTDSKPTHFKSWWKKARQRFFVVSAIFRKLVVRSPLLKPNKETVLWQLYMQREHCWCVCVCVCVCVLKSWNAFDGRQNKQSKQSLSTLLWQRKITKI
jgi:hypothetical protein